MGIYDRDWMRRRDEDPPSANGPVLKPKSPIRRKIVVRIIILAALVILGICFSPNLRQSDVANDRDRDVSQGKPAPQLLRPVNVNKATLDELASIPGIGEKMAYAIIAKRPFHRLEDLTQVPGIKEKKLEQLRLKITIADEP
jgi:competence protein ComEA